MLIIPICLKVAVTLPHLPFAFSFPTLIPYLHLHDYRQDTGRIQDTSYIIQWDASTYPHFRRGEEVVGIWALY